MKFTADDRKSIAHALNHLVHNRIADHDYRGHGGWYSGDKECFIARHKKAVILMCKLLDMEDE